MRVISGLGKRVVDDVYVHLSAIDQALESTQVTEVRALLARIDAPEHRAPNVVKLNLRDDRISLLSYPDFDRSPFPQLAASWTQGPSGELRHRTYTESLNPPILHRKELLVPLDWPDREKWAETTRLAETLGLFDEPHTIGLRGNWDRLVSAKGYQVAEGGLLPLGNSEGAESPPLTGIENRRYVQRHLTALSRTSLSAPMQMLIRTGLLSPGTSIFDYGCGKGDDVRGLSAEGYDAAGWDPYYAPDQPRRDTDLVNLGFVINVIEEPLERAEALRSAATLARRLLVVSVMLQNSSNNGSAFSDGVLSTRNTFQKFFSQEEFRDYLEHALMLPVIMAGPGIALVFKDRELEQRYLIARFRRKDVAARLLISSRRVPRAPMLPRLKVQRERSPTATQLRREELRPLLSELWQLALDLGRWPYADEVPNLKEVEEKGGSLTRALRLVQRTGDPLMLEAASKTRRDDLLLYLAMQQFSKRPAYKRLDERLQRDIKSFFGVYGAAYSAAAALLRETGDPQTLLAACQEAASRGLGYLDSQHSLQLHASMVDRLPPVLRAYIGCGLVLWDETSAVQLIKVHIGSGKITLLEFDEFDDRLLPRLRRRVKINLRKLDYQIFAYGDAENPFPVLYHKSRYINEEYPRFEQQLAFDETLQRTGILDEGSSYGPSEAELVAELELRRLRVGETSLEPSACIPPPDQACGRNFRFRSFIECGETQQRLGIKNIPLNPHTYNALYALASLVLDPVIEYFGGIRLTYGFSSPELAKNIKHRIAPKLDQHAGCEFTRGKTPVCDRGGASCDFYVEDENMREVATWIIGNVPFDRLYFYGDDRPIHVSYGPQNSREAYEMHRSAAGPLIPRRYPA